MSGRMSGSEQDRDHEVTGPRALGRRGVMAGVGAGALAATVGWATARPDAAYAANDTVVTKTASYTATSGDVVLASASAGSIVITIPVAVNTIVTVKKTDASSTNTVTIQLASGSFPADGGTSSIVLDLQGQSRTIACDGTNGWVI
jgi:hypothetical protein